MLEAIPLQTYGMKASSANTCVLPHTVNLPIKLLLGFNANADCG